MKRQLYPLALSLLAIVALPAFAATPIDKTVAANPNGNVSISNVAGSVDITTWNRNEVHVGGTLGEGVTRLAVDKTAEGIEIQVVYPHTSFGRVEGSHLTVQLPAASHLQVNTVSADISAAGLSGPVRLQSVSGDVKLQSKSANLRAETVSGDIVINGSAPGAQVSAHSINGQVQIDGVGGDLDANSVSGDIRLHAASPITGAKFGTTSGNVQFSGALGASGNYDFHSTSGDITLDLSQVPAASFDVTSFSGDITTNFGPTPHRKSEYGPGKEWQFTSGAGNAQVTIATLSGDINLRAAHR